MLTYMTHPDHGTHIAYSPDEVKQCKKNGWKVHGNKPPTSKDMDEPLSAEESAKIPDPKGGPKRGRPKVNKDAD